MFFVGRIAGRRRRGLFEEGPVSEVVGEVLEVGDSLGIGEEGSRIGSTLGIEGELESGRDGGGHAFRNSRDFLTQFTAGFSRSRKGIPRIADCTPIGATKKVS
jgi:hypothetical protein